MEPLASEPVHEANDDEAAAGAQPAASNVCGARPGRDGSIGRRQAQAPDGADGTPTSTKRHREAHRAAPWQLPLLWPDLTAPPCQRAPPPAFQASLAIPGHMQFFDGWRRLDLAVVMLAYLLPPPERSSVPWIAALLCPDVLSFPPAHFL